MTVPLPQPSQIFGETLDRFKITGKRLSEVAGVSANHISDFRRGKVSVSTDILWRLLDAMEQIRPGSRAYFCDLASGKAVAPAGNDRAGRKSARLNALSIEVENLSDEGISALLETIASEWRKRKNTPKVDDYSYV